MKEELMSDFNFYWKQAKNLLTNRKYLSTDCRQALHVIVRLCEKGQKLEAENADLKRQVTEAICYNLSNEGASMIDCRTCFFVSSCEREPQQCEPNYEMCLRAVRKYIEDTGE